MPLLRCQAKWKGIFEVTKASWLVVLGMMLVSCASPVTLEEDWHKKVYDAWNGDWHGVWEIEWDGAPVGGPLVVEVWHPADGRMRMETLESPAATLSGLTLIDDGDCVWLYDIRLDRVDLDCTRTLKIPLASDGLDAIESVLAELSSATVKSTGHNVLESGPSTRVSLQLQSGDQATLWIDEASGLPAGLERDTETWGQVTARARVLGPLGKGMNPLFRFEVPPDAEVVTVE